MLISILKLKSRLKKSSDFSQPAFIYKCSMGLSNDVLYNFVIIIAKLVRELDLFYSSRTRRPFVFKESNSMFVFSPTAVISACIRFPWRP